MRKVMLVIVVIVSAIWLAACSSVQVAETPSNQVTIKRDTYGVPHVYAETVFGLFYGYGYAIAQDRLFSMEMARYSGQGRVSEFLGAGEADQYIKFDRRIRSMYKPDAIRGQLANLPAEDMAVFTGYAAGINAHLAEIRKNPKKLMPKQFGDFNTELANQGIYGTLSKKHGTEKAMQIFNQLVPRVVEGAPTTISSDDWDKAAGMTDDKAPDLLSGQALALANPPNAADSGEAFSNIVIVGRKKAEGALSILMNGPQFGWYTPSYVYSVGLHGAGFDLVGNTPYGYPVVLFGHNGDIAWGSTWGAGDIIDIYREKLNPDNPEEYWHNGRYMPMEKRLETIEVKGGEAVQFPVYRTVHGPVIRVDDKNHLAFAKKRT